MSPNQQLAGFEIRRVTPLPDLRANPRGHHRVRRADLDQLARPRSGPYDPKADAQDIAKLRRLP